MHVNEKNPKREVKGVNDDLLSITRKFSDTFVVDVVAVGASTVIIYEGG